MTKKKYTLDDLERIREKYRQLNYKGKFSEANEYFKLVKTDEYKKYTEPRKKILRMIFLKTIINR